MKLFGAVCALILLTAAAAFGGQPLSATVRVASGDLYDYVVLGAQKQASDGFDNAYDTISPGNLNADLGLPFISVVVPHRDWKPALRLLRGDVRAPARLLTWQVEVTSSLPQGTPLAISLKSDESRLPAGLKIRVQLPGRPEHDLLGGACQIPAPGPGVGATFKVSIENPAEPAP